MSELAVVTGASSGIGREIALALAGRGLDVLAVARRSDRLDELAAAASRAGAGVVHPLAADLADDAAFDSIAARAEALGGASWLVNDAGTNAFGPFGDGDAAAQLAMVRLHCHAVVALTAAVLPRMKARGAGTILNVASIAGLMATPYMAVYGATKAFVVSFSEALREELRGTGVRVTALCPGPVTTDIYEAGAPGVARTPPAHEISAEACARAGVEGALRGKAIVIPGARNRFDVWTARLAPRALVTRVLGRRGLGYLGYARDALKLPP